MCEIPSKEMIKNSSTICPECRKEFKCNFCRASNCFLIIWKNTKWSTRNDYKTSEINKKNREAIFNDEYFNSYWKLVFYHLDYPSLIFQ